MPAASLPTASSAAGLLFLLLLCISQAAPAHAQQLPGTGETTPDSLIERLGLPEGHSPRGALRRAALVPGWGQYYNRQYWKIPFALGGMAAALYGVFYSWDRYFLYRNAWRYRRINGNFVSLDEEYNGEHGGEKYEAAYNEVIDQLSSYQPGEALPTAVKNARVRFHRWAEFSILGSGLFYILQIADAFVSAHLLGFELDEELSMQVMPHRQGGLTTTLQFSF